MSQSRIEASIIALLLWAAGCVGGTGHTRPATTADRLSTSQERALIVFQRSGATPVTTYTVLDATGRYVCDLAPREWCAVEFTPGSHELILMTRGSAFAPHRPFDRLLANVEAGKTYFVWLYNAYQEVRMEVMRPAHARWNEHEQWLAEHQRVIPDEAAGTAEIREEPDVLEEDVADARELWAEDRDDVQRQARTMHPNDGIPHDRAFGSPP